MNGIDALDLFNVRRLSPILTTSGQPDEAAFAAFVEAYEAARDRPLHVHCVANYRVSAFFYRYRRDRLGWGEAAARRDLDAVWSPDPVWRAFIGDPVRDAPRLVASEARWP